MPFRGDLDALIMGVLVQGRMHGYEISKRINDSASGAVQVREAQLYPLLHGLENDGLIEAEWLPQEGKPSRKVYRLTDQGRQALQAKRSAWEAFARGVSSILDGKSTEVARG